MANLSPKPTFNAPVRGNPVNVPHPAWPLAPFMAPTTPQRASYDSWEVFTIKAFLRSLPEPTGPDPPELVAENRRLLERYKARVRYMLSHMNTLNPQERLEWYKGPIAEQLAEAVWKPKILLCRLFPINDLPVEILLQIFHYIVWDAKPSVPSVTCRLWLTWVCRRWREVAIADPCLWNAIWFNDVPDFERSLEFFRRAGGAPLELRINDDQRPENAPVNEAKALTAPRMERLLDVLFTKADQITIFVAIIEAWPAVHVLLDRFYNCPIVPTQLKRIEIHRTGKPYVVDAGLEQPHKNFDHAFTFCNGRATAVDFVCLNGVHFNWDTTPLHNLNTLDLRRVPVENGPSFLRLRDILANCPQINRLVFDGAGPRWPGERGDMNFVPITLPTLEVFIIGNTSLLYAMFLVRLIDAPNVLDFTMLNYRQEDYTFLFQALTGKFPNLRFLTLYELDFGVPMRDPDIVVRWIMSMSTLEYLRVAAVRPNLLQFLNEDGRSYLNPNTPETLAPDQEPAPKTLIRLFPKLRVVEYQHIPTSEIMEFYEARQQMGIPLIKIYVRADYAPRLKPEERVLLAKLGRLVGISPMYASTPEERAILAVARHKR
ncbi:hypothetical protein OF83DRAFT_1266417 [Amylostereum chailletii]|nr:hypothetical protein OF83DRAFT_1266417 [Amylostereum chailletii]